MLFGLRYWRQTILGKIGSEDYAIVVAQILAAGCAITNTLQVKKGALGRHIDTAQPQELDTFSKVIISRLHILATTDLFRHFMRLLRFTMLRKSLQKHHSSFNIDACFLVKSFREYALTGYGFS